MNVPNMLTLARILAVPLTIWLILSEAWQLAFWLFALAGATDALDGYLARRLNQRTDIGAYLDATADKALLVSVYLTLAVMDVIPLWLAILVIARDVMIVGAVIIAWLVNQPLAIRPLRISKANTGAQIVFAGLVLAHAAFGLPLDFVLTLALWTVAALTLASTAAYLAQWVRHMSGFETR